MITDLPPAHLLPSGRAQREVLRVLRRSPRPQTARQVAQAIAGDAFRSTTDTENVRRTLGRLEGKGLVQHVGDTLTGGRTWAPTERGRQVPA